MAKICATKRILMTPPMPVRQELLTETDNIEVFATYFDSPALCSLR
jgi:hypothetical protein